MKRADRKPYVCETRRSAKPERRRHPREKVQENKKILSAEKVKKKPKEKV